MAKTTKKKKAVRAVAPGTKKPAATQVKHGKRKNAVKKTAKSLDKKGKQVAAKPGGVRKKKQAAKKAVAGKKAASKARTGATARKTTNRRLAVKPRGARKTVETKGEQAAATSAAGKKAVSKARARESAAGKQAARKTTNRRQAVKPRGAKKTEVTKKKQAAKKAAAGKKAASKARARESAAGKQAARKPANRKKALKPRAAKKRATRKAVAREVVTGRLKSQIAAETAPAAELLTRPPVVISNPNWRAVAHFNLKQEPPVTSFICSMVVPPAPTAVDIQTIMIFSGLQSKDRILQPILQWGHSQMNGGGAFWSVGCCLARGMFGLDVASPLIQVAPGRRVTAVIRRSPGAANRFRYTCSFDTFPATKIDTGDIEELYNCCVTLEAVDLTARAQYPPDPAIVVKNIAIKSADQEMTPAWQFAGTPRFNERATLLRVPGERDGIELMF